MDGAVRNVLRPESIFVVHNLTVANEHDALGDILPIRIFHPEDAVGDAGTILHYHQ